MMHTICLTWLGSRSVRILLAALLFGQLDGGALASSRAPATSHVRPHRYLDAVSSPVPYPWIIGKDWPRKTRVRLTVTYRGATGRVTLRTDGAGTFGVGIEGVRRCTGLIITAVDTTNYRVVLHGANPFRLCPSVTERRGIRIHRLTKRQMRAREIIVDGRRLSPSYTVRVGDMVYVYVHQGYLSLQGFGDGHPFRLIERGVVPRCPPNADCMFPPGTYYRVVAVRHGRAMLPVGHGRYAVILVQ